MWTSAARLAELVASYRRAPQRPEKTRKGRTLPEADFEFRGGFAHPPSALSSRRPPQLTGGDD
jgi:hypothetical protein